MQDEDLLLLAAVLRTNTVLTHLNLARNQLTDVSGGYLAKVLRQNTVLHELNMAQNSGISSASKALISQSLQANPKSALAFLGMDGFSVLRDTSTLRIGAERGGAIDAMEVRTDANAPGLSVDLRRTGLRRRLKKPALATCCLRLVTRCCAQAR